MSSSATKQCSNNTGEPPTEMSTSDGTRSSRQSVTFSDAMSLGRESIRRDSLSLSQLVHQEADSGYEASPSSNRGSYGFSFDASFGSSSNEPSSGGEFHRGTADDASSAIPLDLTDVAYSSCDDDDDDDDDVDKRFLMVRCESDNTQDIDRSGAHSEERPTSLPIPIPISESASRRSVNFADTRSSQPVHASSLPAGAAAAAMRMDSVSTVRPSTLYPLSWPAFRPFVTWWMRPLSTTDANDSPVRCHGGVVASQGNVFDSDVCSISSSESDNQEDVFDDEVIVDDQAEVPAVSSAPTANGHLFTAFDGSAMSSVSWNDVRRSRSVSVSLPLERDLQQACLDVGQALRRLSDQFSTQLTLRRQEPRGRRNTLGVGDFSRLSVRMNQNRRDTDGDPDIQPPGSSRTVNCQSQGRRT